MIIYSDPLPAIRNRIEFLNRTLPAAALERRPLQATAEQYNALARDHERVRAGFKPSHGIKSLKARREQIEADLARVEKGCIP